MFFPFKDEFSSLLSIVCSLSLLGALQVKEYMAWRLKRNRRRLIHLDRAARVIQGKLRAYLAQKRVQDTREHRACIYIQRLFRGWRGRLDFLEM